MARERRLFSEEFKREAVKLVGQLVRARPRLREIWALAPIFWVIGAEMPTSLQRS